MLIFEDVAEWTRFQTRFRHKQVGLVPTMGALHRGHLALVDKAKSMCDVVVVTIFVNPMQFNNAEDFEKYPRHTELDIKALEKNGKCDVLVLPNLDQMQAYNMDVEHVDLGKLDQCMEGINRPGHFQGVMKIVKALFEMVVPNRAFFGEKDFQQLAIIRSMVEQQKLPIEIVPISTVREESGLALSSRNERLTQRGRELASRIYTYLSRLKRDLRKGEYTWMQLQKEVKQKLLLEGCEVEYLELAQNQSLEIIRELRQNMDEYRIFVAAYVEGVRLIDNISIAN